MRTYGVPKGAAQRSGHKAIFGADGQIPKVETGAERTSDSFDNTTRAKYPAAGEHAISLPGPTRNAGSSPSERPTGHPNEDQRPHPRMPQEMLGGVPNRVGLGKGILGRAKVMLSDRAFGRAAGEPGGNFGHPNRESERIRYPEPDQDHISEPGRAAAGRPASLSRDEAPEREAHRLREKGNFRETGGGSITGRKGGSGLY